MAKAKERLVAKITTNSYTMRQLHLNLNQDQHQEELQSNSRQSQLEQKLEQKGAQISRGEVIGDPMLLLQVELEPREVLEAKIISLKVTQTPHLKTSKEQWSRIRTLWRYHNPLLFLCGTLRALCHNNAIITGKYLTVPPGQSPKITKINSNDNHNSPPIALPQPTL